MALDSDGLLDHLLFKIALSAEHGLDIHGLSDTVTSFYAQSPAGIEEENNEPEVDLLFSLKPPGSASSRSFQASDPQRLEKLWTWLAEHPDITLEISDDQVADVPNATIGQDSSINTTPLATFFLAHANERLYANENQIWLALTDHGVDYRRVPKLEFKCLSVIASAGPDGLLQPEVTRLTGQDKRSVPKRTDALAKKGLIVKELCVGLGIKTSLVRFKKFVQHDKPSTLFEVGENAGQRGIGGSRRMIRYEDWFSEIIGHLRKNNSLMAVEDLRKEMGINGKKWETRSLHRCMRRLGKTGLLQRLKARSSPTDMQYQEDVDDDSDVDANVETGTVFGADADADADAEADADDVDDQQEADQAVTPKKRARKSGPPKIRWVRCVKLMREPTEKDMEAFTSNAKAERGDNEEVPDDAEPEDKEQGEHQTDGETLNANLKSKKVTAESKQRIAPQWHPGIHHTQFLFNLIHSTGPNGLSTMDLTNRAMGHFWRRPLDELLGRLTDVWTVSQPPHLRHLSLIRDTAFLSRTSHYQFRSFVNFKKLVDAGQVTWEAMGIKSSQIDNEEVETDRWGFSRVKPTAMAGLDGTANMANCKATIDKPHQRRAYDPSRKNRIYVASTRAATPVGKPSLTIASTPQQIGGGTNSQPRQFSFVSPGGVKLPPGSTPVETGKTPGKILFKMKPNRVQAELREWEARSKRLAMSLARAEAGHSHSLTTDQESANSEPTSKRRKMQAVSDKARNDLSLDSQADGNGPRTTVDPQTVDDTRVAEIEAKILSMSESRAYINPPGSGQTKMSITQPTGRPSRYLIAVIKSPRLHSFNWFNEDTYWTQPAPRKVRSNARTRSSEAGTILATLRAQSVDTVDTAAEPGDPSLSSFTPVNDQARQTKQPKPDFIIKGGRKRRVRGSLMEHVIKRQATIGSQGEPTYTAPVDSSSTVDDQSLTIQNEGYRRRVSENTTQSSAPTENAESTLRPASVDMASSGKLSPMGKETVQSVDTLMPDATSEAAFDGTESTQDRVELPLAKKHPGSEMQAIPANDQPTQGHDIATPIVSEGLDMIPSIMPVDRNVDDATPRRPSQHAILSVEPAMKDLVKTPKRTPNPRTKVGVPRSGGITKHQRETILLSIIRKHNGVFGGDTELHLPFIAEWEKHHTQRPDRHTLERMLRSMVADGKLQKIAFTFQTAKNNVVTKHIVTEPEIDPESQEVKLLQHNMIAAYPSLYIPGTMGLAPNLEVQDHAGVQALASKARSKQLTVRDTFPEDESTFISRLHPPDRRVTVKLGMTEAKLAKDGASRRRRREQEERRQERYFRALQEERYEEEIDEGPAEFRTDFQLDSYQHEPDRARIDRGPKGRGRLAKLHRWGAFGDAAQKKAGGLLGAAKKQQLAELPEPAQHGHSTRDGYYAPPSSAVQPGFGSTIIEVLTMTTPYQRFHSASGTFSTDSRVVIATSHPSKSGAIAQTRPTKEQIPMALADIIRQAQFTELDPALAELSGQFSLMRPGMPGIHDLLSYTLPRRHNKQLDTSSITMNPSSGGKTSRVPRLSRLMTRQAPQSRVHVPRASRSGIFVMTETEERRLIVALAVIRALTGGLEQTPNWNIVHQVFHYKFDANYCRNRWGQIRGRLSGTVDKLQVKFQELYIEAYERGDIAEIDFLDLQKYDWLGLVEWAEERLDTGKIESMANELPDLPVDRKVLDVSFEIKVPDESYNIAKDDFWMPLVTNVRREELAKQWTRSVVSKQTTVKHDPLMLYKSWLRANVLTPEIEFNAVAARDKLAPIGLPTLDKCIEELLGAKIIRREKKNLPGRELDISDTVLSTFKRTWDADFLRLAAAYKETLDSQFAEHGKVELDYNEPDHKLMVLTNLISGGRARVVARLPPVNNDFDAPWPRLTKWGFADGNWKTVQMDRGRMHFWLEVHPTETYVYGNPLVKMTPPLTLQVEGEAGARLPLWTNIEGKLIQSVWDMMLMATLHILAFRPGLTVEGMTSVYKDKLWAWEIELFLQWAEKAGLARRFGSEEDAGWTAAEWWFMAFAWAP